jgi:uncharacterized lipoprotein YehR (DUF1307 family)
MQKLIPVILISATLFACGSPDNSATKAEPQVEITHTEINSEVNKTLAKLSISGMMCSAGCGGKIQQDLSAMAGVTSISMDYEDNREANVVTVEYNPTEVNELEFIQKVNSIANGKYQVKAVEVVTFKGLQTARTSGGSTTGAALKENFSKMVHVFDLVQSISKLVTSYSR